MPQLQTIFQVLLPARLVVGFARVCSVLSVSSHPGTPSTSLAHTGYPSHSQAVMTTWRIIIVAVTWQARIRSTLTPFPQWDWKQQFSRCSIVVVQSRESCKRSCYEIASLEPKKKRVCIKSWNPWEICANLLPMELAPSPPANRAQSASPHRYVIAANICCVENGGINAITLPFVHWSGGINGWKVRTHKPGSPRLCRGGICTVTRYVISQKFTG